MNEISVNLENRMRRNTMRNGIILGIGSLILLLALAGAGSARPSYMFFGGYTGCAGCHGSGFDGIFFYNTHKFNGTAAPTVNAPYDSCTNCHVRPPNNVNDWTDWDMSLTANGSEYNVTHRYNGSTLASEMLAEQYNESLTPAGGCYNCHVDAAYNNFTLLSSTPTYLTSAVCKDCHKAKYDNWTDTLHAVMLTNGSKANQTMHLPTPSVGWANISYVIVSKFTFAYINTTGYFLAQNDSYNTETEEFESDSHAGGRYGTCGNCHTTGWNTTGFNYGLLNGILPGFNATSFSEPGIGCERCHGSGGNGHQVTVNYSGTLCTACHTGGSHGTGWENSEHYPPAAENGNSCLKCHSPFDKYQNPNVTLANTTAQSCGVCHNIHDMTDSKYADTFSNGNFNAATWSVVADAKLSFFNATASAAAGTDIFDNLSNAVIYPGSSAGIGTGQINLTGKPISEVLCSECHYNHGLAHTSGVNLTHGTYYHGQSNAATCTDCHMKGANATVGKDMMKSHSNDIFIFNKSANSALADPANSCGGTTKSCHTASSQNQSASKHSMVPIFNEWNASAHNDKVVGIDGGYNHFYGNFSATTGFGNQQANTCLQCKSPINWDPSNTDNSTKINLTDFHGISCMVCHDIHDMGAWLNMTKAKYGVSKYYAWYNKTAVRTSYGYKAAYTMMDNTTQLCGNCHNNIRAGNTGPGWTNATSRTKAYLKVGNLTPVGTHGIPAAAVFAGSWKQTGLLNFECIDCHWSTNTSNLLPDSQKVAGHSFDVNVTLLQNDSGTQTCSTCHTTGSTLGNLSTTISNVQNSTQTKWNNTNATFAATMAAINAYNGEKNLSMSLIAQAYWDLSLVSTEGSWGVHNPTMDNQLLDDAVTLANEANASLGQSAAIASSVQLKAGWNLVALSGTPAVTSAASVMSSVANSITIVWGYDTTTNTWEVYDPGMPSSLDTLTNIVPGQGYWIYSNANVVWTA